MPGVQHPLHVHLQTTPLQGVWQGKSTLRAALRLFHSPLPLSLSPPIFIFFLSAYLPSPSFPFLFSSLLLALLLSLSLSLLPFLYSFSFSSPSLFSPSLPLPCSPPSLPCSPSFVPLDHTIIFIQVVCGSCSQWKAFLRYLKKSERICEKCYNTSKSGIYTYASMFLYKCPLSYFYFMDIAHFLPGPTAHAHKQFYKFLTCLQKHLICS